MSSKPSPTIEFERSIAGYRYLIGIDEVGRGAVAGPVAVGAFVVDLEQLDESQIQWLIHYYVARYEALSGTRVDQEHFMRVFDLMSVQRNFKAIGSFASFYNKRGNPVYLKYIGNTFENIRRSLLKYPKYSALRETLFYYYYF